MRTRPIFHSSDAAIRGHVFCPFLALSMQKHLDDLARQAGLAPEWKELLRDLDRLQQVLIAIAAPIGFVRTDAVPTVSALFKHAHIALPPRSRQARLRRHPSPNPSEHAAAAQGVVPRKLEFRQNDNTINFLQNSGVQVGADAPTDAAVNG